MGDIDQGQDASEGCVDAGKVANRPAHSTMGAGPVLRSDFDDATLWHDLAAERGLRLPRWGQKATTRRLGRWLRRVGIEPLLYAESVGMPHLTAYIEANPEFPLRSLVGIALEEVAGA